LPRPAPTPPSGARSMAGTLEDVQRLVEKARSAKRFAILTLTTDDEPLRDELLGLAVSLADESVYVPLGHRPAGSASGALFAPAELDAARAIALVEGARRRGEALGEDLRADPELFGLYSEIEKPLIEVLASLELTGIRVDVPRLQRLSEEIGRQIDALLQEIFQLAGGEFLPASTQQLAEVLYKRLNLPVLKRGKTGPSTDQEVLEELAQQHPLPAKVLEHRQLVKLKSTYLDALPAALGKDGRLHTTFDQAVAATGRLASINPNLQNIPIRTPLGAKIREAFVPRTGWKLLSADYSQIELRVLAHVSSDPVLRDSFLSNEDLHARTAGETFGVPSSEVTRQQRDIAKMINYGI